MHAYFGVCAASNCCCSPVSWSGPKLNHNQTQLEPETSAHCAIHLSCTYRAFTCYLRQSMYVPVELYTAINTEVFRKVEARVKLQVEVQSAMTTTYIDATCAVFMAWLTALQLVTSLSLQLPWKPLYRYSDPEQLAGDCRLFMYTLTF